MEIVDKVESLLISNHGEGVVLGRDEMSTPQALIVAGEKILDVCKLLHETNEFYFDLLSCITGIDNGPENNTMEVIYHLYSIPLGHELALKVELDRNNPEIPSVARVWRTADWHEREAYDLLGIVFLEHPDMRRILMPGDWEGHPLRKDYVEPETYRGMKTIRDEESD